jgi:P4 family phage/plasmid primase-like protien
LNNTIYQAHLEYTKFGWDTLPIPPDDNGNPHKSPEGIKAWPKRAAEHDFTEQDFELPNTNLGGLLGPQSKPSNFTDAVFVPPNLTDIDCDTPLAVKIAAWLLPTILNGEHTCKFGRPGKPVSHYLYYTDESLPSERIMDPLLGMKGCIIEYRCLKKNGLTRGMQTVFPPSVWRDKDNPENLVEEQIDFVPGCGPEKIATVNARDLLRLTHWIAAVVLMAKYYPQSDRHYTKRAWASVLYRGKFSAIDAEMLIRLAYQNSANPGNDDSKDSRDVQEVCAAIESGEESHLYGWPKLQEHYDPKVLKKIRELLDIPMVPTVQDSVPATEGPEGSEPDVSCVAQYSLDDIGNAQRFVDKFKEKVRFCPQEKSYFVWDGIRWKKDDCNHIQELAQTLSSDIKNEALAMNSAFASAKQKSLLTWGTRSAMSERISAVAKQASSNPAILITKEQFDTHDHLLNCTNGVVDLHTGTLMPHEPNLFLTQLCPSEYRPTATAPDWVNVLNAVTRKHPELIPFLQRFAGYIAQGNKGQDVLALCHGQGGTGKGTFWNAIQKTLGKDFCRSVSAHSLLKQDRSGSAASGDIARLEGCRLAMVSEFERGSKLQENFLKLASGNDTITARRLYGEEIEFEPTFQLVFQSNHRPEFNSNDTGNRRRYIEIPFDNVIADDPSLTLDTGLKKRLSDDPNVHQAVLAWIVAGCVAWKKDGLEIPECVKAATAELFRQNDLLGDFWLDCITEDKNSNLPVAVAQAVYLAWCREEGTQPVKDRTFTKLLNERGLKSKSAWIDGKNRKSWAGIKLTKIATGLIETPEEQEDRVMQFLSKKAS